MLQNPCVQIQELARREMDVVVVLDRPLLNKGLAFQVPGRQELEVEGTLATHVGMCVVLRTYINLQRKNDRLESGMVLKWHTYTCLPAQGKQGHARTHGVACFSAWF